MANELVQGLLALMTGETLAADASEVPFTPTGTIAATTVQTAVAEAASEAVHLTGTETITGAKTFSVAPVAPGVTAPAATSLALTTPLGAGATDVCAKVGSSVADGSVNATAKLFSIRTGIGGTESEKMYVTKNGSLNASGGLLTGGDISCGAYNWVMAGIYGHGVNVSSFTNKIWGGGGLSGASDVHCVIGSATTDAATPSTAKLLSIRTGVTGTEVEKANIKASGEVEVIGAGVGIILRSPDGTAYRLTIANGGTVSVAAV